MREPGLHCPSLIELLTRPTEGTAPHLATQPAHMTTRVDQLTYGATQLREYVSVCVTYVYVYVCPCSCVCDQDCATFSFLRGAKDCATYIDALGNHPRSSVACDAHVRRGSVRPCKGIYRWYKRFVSMYFLLR